MKNPILSKISSSSDSTNAMIHQETNFEALQNIVVRYVYQETSSIENSKIEVLLQSNEKLNQFFYEVIDLKKQMDDCQTRHKPSNQLVDKILNYSKK